MKLALAMLAMAAVAAFADAATVLAEGQTPATRPATRAASGRDLLPKSELAWEKLNTEPYPGKQDDLCFVSPKLGWYVNGAGKIFRTDDGGTTWVRQLHKPGTYFRCLAFVDESVGFAGNIGPGYFPNVTDDTALYTTRDGGKTWAAVDLGDAKIVGLCAIQVLRVPFINAGHLDHRVRIIGVGRVGGPAAMIVSDDLGKTWRRIALPDVAGMALDVHFFDADNGILASASSKDVEKSAALILRTADGGKTWEPAYRGERKYELTWKIAAPTDSVAYVTIQSYDPAKSATKRYVAKSVDAGKTWAELPLVDDARVREFGIAFVNADRGWVGAMPGGFETTDGGKTWKRADLGNAANKIRVVAGDGKWHVFAIGVNVFRTAVEQPK